MSDLREELYSLLVPLAGERLIVPRACVEEGISYQAPAEMTNAPPWYAGLVSWSGRSVPIVSFEGAFGQALPTVSNRTRIVICNASGGRLQSGYFGMLTQGLPQLVRVNADVVRPDPQRSRPERRGRCASLPDRLRDKFCGGLYGTRRRAASEILDERGRRLDDRQPVSAALLAGVDDHRTPVRGLRFGLRGVQAHDTALAQYRYDSRHAEFRRLLHDEVHAIAARHALHERDG